MPRSPSPLTPTNVRPLTVNKRSFLDPGPVVPVGTEQIYVTLNTTYN